MGRKRKLKKEPKESLVGIPIFDITLMVIYNKLCISLYADVYRQKISTQNKEVVAHDYVRPLKNKLSKCSVSIFHIFPIFDSLASFG